MKTFARVKIIEGERKIFVDSLSHNLLRRISEISNNSICELMEAKRIPRVENFQKNLLAACWMDEAFERRKNSFTFAGTENGKVLKEQEIFHAYLVNGNLVKNVFE